MEEKLQEYADELIELLRTGAEFAGEQAPLFVQELLTYYTWHHSIWLMIGLMLLSVFGFLVRYIKRHRKQHTFTEEAAVLFALITFAAGLPITIVNLLALIKVLVAPRLYLIETLQGIL